MRNKLIAIIKDLSDNPLGNPEYVRGQLEMATDILGYEDDGYYDRKAILSEAFPNLTNEELDLIL